MEVAEAQEIPAALDQGVELESLPFIPECCRCVTSGIRRQCRGKRARHNHEKRACTECTTRYISEPHDATAQQTAGANGVPIYWQDAWLRRIEGPETISAESQGASANRPLSADAAVSSVACARAAVDAR